MTGRRGRSGDTVRNSERLDQLLALLADERRRRIIRYFQTAERDVASVETLVDYAIEQTEARTTRGQVELMLHHTTLPKMAEAGLIEYDASTGTVRYCGAPLAEQLLAAVAKTDVQLE